MSKINKINSNKFEHYCINKHTNDFNEITYHWSNIPEDLLYKSGFIKNYHEFRLNRLSDHNDKKINSIQEYGLDGLSIIKTDDNEENNIYNGLQMKLWNDRSYLTADKLGSFIHVILLRLKIHNTKSKGYLYYTCRLEKNIKADFTHNNDYIYPIHLKNPFLNEPIIEQVNDIVVNINNFDDENKYILRDYQQEAVNKLNEEWCGIKLLNLICGTGKTIIFSHHLRDRQYKNVFIVSPLKVHVKQNLDRVKKFLPEYKDLLLDSDLTTNFLDVEAILNDKCIISTTFESFENVLSNLFYINDIDNDSIDNDNINDNDSINDSFDNSYESNFEAKYDLNNTILIIDEAHNIINKSNLIKIVKSFPRILLVTATPPIEMDEILNSDIIYQYKLSDAIRDGYICDYKIYVPLIEIKDGLNIVDIDQPNELIDLDNNLCKKGLFLINGMLDTGSRKCIVYFNSIEECNEFKICINKIMNNYHGLPYWIDIITSDISHNKRDYILKCFENETNEERPDIIKILLSIRILNEGIDIVKCDSIFIGNVGEHSSDIVTLQRLCRANRLDKNNPNKISNCFMWCDDLCKTINSLQLLKNEDVNFYKKINVIGSNYDKKGNTIETEKIMINNKNYLDHIKIKCMDFNELWEMKKNLLFEYCNIYNKVPRNKDIYNNNNIGLWLQCQKNKIKNINDNLYLKLSSNEYVKISIDNYLNFKENNKDKYNFSWDESKNLLFEYCNINNKVPPKTHKYKNNNVGDWLSGQKKKIHGINDDLYIKLSENKYVKQSIDDCLKFRKNNKDKTKFTWDESKDLLFEYCNNNNNIPTRNIIYKNNNIGSWLHVQKNNIKDINNDLYIELSKNKYVRQSIDDCLKKRYNNNTKDNLTWDQWKDLLFEYTNNNNRVPIRNEKYKNYNIGSWLSQQKNKIKDTNDDLYIKLSKNEYVKLSIDGCFEFRENNKDKTKFTWDESKDLLFEFCDINNKIPSKYDIYKNNRIGKWLDTQKLKIKDVNDDLYIKLSMNNYIKKSIDDCLKYRENNKDKIKLTRK